MRFRPCIDLHEGQVKQIVGSSLTDRPGEVTTNFVAAMPPDYFADLYYRDGLEGGHVIMLGKGNEDAARLAVGKHPGTLQVGGGITPENAKSWLEAGASKVIVTSALFVDGLLSDDRIQAFLQAVPKDSLVFDLSCRKTPSGYYVATNRWQTITPTLVCKATLERLANACSEYLIHAVDVEGKQQGIDGELVSLLAQDCPLPVTYAGGVKNMDDILSIQKYGNNRIDATVGSALDIFGGNGVSYSEMVAFDKQNRNPLQ